MKTAAPTPSLEFVAAQDAYRKIADERTALNESLEAMHLAVSLAANGSADSERVPQHLKERAAPYLQKARRSPGRMISEIEDTSSRLDDLMLLFPAAAEAWGAAQSRETSRIAKEIQPQHQAAVAKMIGAVEALSIAIAAEREARRELAQLAPLPSSPYLPDLSGDLLIGTLGDPASPASIWAGRIRKFGIGR